MKKYSILLVVAVVAIGVFVSCKKGQLPFPSHTGNGNGNGNGGNSVVRKVRYELYTNENFAGQTKNIHFSVFMRNDKNHKQLIDSPLAVMKVQGIPDFNHRIVIEKEVPANVAADAVLTVGFTYYLENVGYSWYLDTIAAGNTFKLVNYSFK
jgi:hypothetical protein